MKRFLPLLALLGALGFALSTLRPPEEHTPFDTSGFGRLPVLANGRIKPLDTVARSALLQLQGRQSVIKPDAPDLSFTATLSDLFLHGGKQYYAAHPAPTEWLLDVLFASDRSDTYQTLAIDNPDVLALFNLKPQDGLGNRRFSFSQLTGKLGELQRQAQLASAVDEPVRTAFQRGVLQLYENLLHYQRLKHMVVMPGQDDFLGDLLHFQDQLVTGVAAVRAKQAGQPADETAVTAMTTMGEQFMTMSESTNLLAIPPDTGNPDPNAWQTTGAALLETFQRGSVNSSALAYAGLAHAWRHNQPDQFNHLVGLYHDGLAKRFAPQLAKCVAETRFNSAEPFYTSIVLYALAFFVAIVSWLAWPNILGKSAFYLVAVAWIVATAGIATRMWLEGRPPVTNLYSSALFVGWGAVALCLVLEAIYKNAIGSVAAGTIGFSTLLIAHHLALGGDTLEMMRAVLDSNFWLATHVVVVSTGYAATFLAGFLALIYIFRGLFTTTLDQATADALTRMVYGIVCFATLFSFTGTVLGGIWADQSWGRFWGWDPKENGALIIVIWNAIILHARWGGMVKQRGLMCLAVGGNIVTSWSWFGVNMLGVGLHSYGFTEAAFFWLIAFVVSQAVVIGLANLPLAKWRSFQPAAKTVPADALPAK